MIQRDLCAGRRRSWRRPAGGTRSSRFTCFRGCPLSHTLRPAFSPIHATRASGATFDFPQNSFVWENKKIDSRPHNGHTNVHAFRHLARAASPWSDLAACRLFSPARRPRRPAQCGSRVGRPRVQGRSDPAYPVPTLYPPKCRRRRPRATACSGVPRGALLRPGVPLGDGLPAIPPPSALFCPRLHARGCFV
jgi:hypothetical protein